MHCECSDPGSSIIQDDPLCQSVSNDAGHSSTSLRPCTTLTFPTSLPSRFLPRGRSTDNMAEFSLNAGCYEVKVETFGDLTLKTLSLTLASWSTSKLRNSKSSKSIHLLTISKSRRYSLAYGLVSLTSREFQNLQSST